MKSFFTLMLFFSLSSFAQGVRDENEIVFVGATDPDMVAAIRGARTGLDDFLKLAISPPDGSSGFKIKVVVKDANGVEHFWVTPFNPKGDAFEGRLANDPRVVRSVRAGQLIQFTRNEVSDWGYVKDGRQVGSYTICVLFKKMPREQADYYRKNHGFMC